MNLTLKIVNFLSKNREKIFTINEISKELKQYYSYVNRVIDRLAKDRVIVRNKAGKAYLCTLNFENEKTLTLLSLSEIESKDEFYTKNKELKIILEDFVKSIEVKNNIVSMALFGSYAKGTATKESDIDILVISKEKTIIDKTTREISAKYGKEINAIIMSPKDFKNQKDKPLIKEIISNHYILYGADKFVELVFK